MIKYIGSKRLLVPLIVETVSRIAAQGTVLDLFSGTSRVGHALKRSGFRVAANDHNAYAATLGRCYVAADAEDHLATASKLVREFNALPGAAGYFTETFCEKSRFFQPKNGARVDAIRESIARKGLEPELEAILLVSLMEAADRVDSTTGVQMAYLKQWAPRAFHDIELRVPDILPRAASGKSTAHQLDAVAAAAGIEADIAYIDPPYNQHKYLGNYHIWESLVLWDKPEVYGIACKRVDCRERNSAFNSKVQSREALASVFREAASPHLVVSFNNEGYFGREAIESMLADREFVFVISQDFKRYVGAQIGIHNPKGERVGEVSHLRNTEYIYIATSDAAVAGRISTFCDRVNVAAPAAMPRGAATGSVTPSRAGSASSGSAVRGGDLQARVLAGLMEQARSSAELQTLAGCDAAAVRATLLPMVQDGLVATSGARRGMRYALTERGRSVAAVRPDRSAGTAGNGAAPSQAGPATFGEGGDSGASSPGIQLSLPLA